MRIIKFGSGTRKEEEKVPQRSADSVLYNNVRRVMMMSRNEGLT